MSNSMLYKLNRTNVYSQNNDEFNRCKECNKVIYKPFVYCLKCKKLLGN